MDWHIGQRVVCVRTGFSANDPAIAPLPQPIVGQVYTIRGFNLPTPEFPELNGTGVGFYLEEIRTPVYQFQDGPKEVSYDQSGFRPVRETDISVFTKMLEVAPQPVVV